MNEEAENILRQWNQDINKMFTNMLLVQLKMGLFFSHIGDDNQFLRQSGEYYFQCLMCSIVEQITIFIKALTVS